MSGTVVGILGFLTIIAIVVLLFQSRTLPSIAFITVPAILGVVLVIGGYYTWDNIAALIKAGFGSTGPTATLFVFSVLYFGIMTDAGMFDVIIGKLMKLVGDNVIGVTLMTAVIALIGHLDGGGASTFCIVVPAMLPVYKRMHMRPTTLLRIAVLAMGVLNLMPWAGPTMRAASVLGIEAGSLWSTIIPIQIFGIVLCLAHAVLAGVQEKARGAGLTGKLAKEEGEVIVDTAAEDASKNELARPKLFWFNLLLTIAVIALLIKDIFPSYVPFMFGVAIAILVNYPGAKMQKKVINLHAGPALMMCSTLMGAAVLMGILVKTVEGADGTEIASVVTNMSSLITMILPAALGRHLPIVIGILSVPLALAFDTDSYFYGMLPVMIGIGAEFGIQALPIAIAMVVCRNCATFISPMVPATLLGVGLADVDIKDHIKASFLYVWAFSIICMLFAIIIGIMPF
ncbi:MAG: citrate:proton symporter [Lachnospiraceae bacterium]|jgi:CitMHS family citrate-Mg2+:H+ or citrate-Ca2+:H+ symporter|nr:citrate transporter [Lachnospiraceae bacterium]MBR6399254.1 citrate transporter [Lachnospiraceae bacterium]MEE3377474.1 citrate:proton symporter [Lachnospiraceae bacterium]MEE3457502.1 citrate:proton symporter [Lachnospiraceae bacterium]